MIFELGTFLKGICRVREDFRVRDGFLKEIIEVGRIFELGTFFNRNL